MTVSSRAVRYLSCGHRRLVVGLLVGVLLFALGCKTVRHTVRPVNVGEAPPVAGVVYTLPKTRLIITLPIKATETKAGPFFRFYRNLKPEMSAADPAEIRDRLIEAGIVPSQELYVKLTKHPEQFRTRIIKIGQSSLASESIPDPEHRYVVEWPESATQARSLELELNERGFLTNASSTGDDQTIDTAVKVLQVTASVAGRFFGFAPAEGPTQAQDDVQPLVPVDDLIPPPINLKEITLLKLEALLDLSNKRNEVVLSTSGQPPLSNEQLKQRLEIIDKQIAVLRAFFVTKKVTTWSAKFRYEPQPDGVSYAAPLLEVKQLSDTEKNKNYIVQFIHLTPSGPIEFISQPLPKSLGSPDSRGETILISSHDLMVSVIPNRPVARPAGDTEGYRYREPWLGRVEHWV